MGSRCLSYRLAYFFLNVVIDVLLDTDALINAVLFVCNPQFKRDYHVKPCLLLSAHFLLFIFIMIVIIVGIRIKLYIPKLRVSGSHSHYTLPIFSVSTQGCLTFKTSQALLAALIYYYSILSTSSLSTIDLMTIVYYHDDNFVNTSS